MYFPLRWGHGRVDPERTNVAHVNRMVAAPPADRFLRGATFYAAVLRETERPATARIFFRA